MSRVCSDCGAAVSRGSRTGFCRICAPKHADTRNRFNQAPLPDDFAEYAPGRGTDHLEAHYGVGEKTIRRWRKESGVRRYDAAVDGKTPLLIPVPDDFADRVPELRTVAKLAAHYHRDIKTIKRWLERAAITLESAAARRSAGRWGDHQPKRHRAPDHHRIKLVPGHVTLPAFRNIIPAPLSGREQEAAQHLRRFYPSVHHCTKTGGFDPKGEFWRIGNAIITGADLIAKAEARGWRPDLWQEIAA